MVSVTAKQSCLDSDSKLKCLTRNGLSCLSWKSPLGARGRRGLRRPSHEASSCGPHGCPASPTWQGREAPSGGPLPSGFAWVCLSRGTAGGRGGGRAGTVRGAVREACVLVDTEWSRVRVQPCRRHSEPTQDHARWGQGAFKHPTSPGVFLMEDPAEDTRALVSVLACRPLSLEPGAVTLTPSRRQPTPSSGK